MNEEVKIHIDKYPNEIIDMYNNLRQIIFESVYCVDGCCGMSYNTFKIN